MPPAGSDLVFPSGAANVSTSNDIAAGTSFNSITFGLGASDYTLAGNALTLAGGASSIVCNHTSGTMTISLSLTISTANATITTTSGGNLVISGTVDNGGFRFTIDGTGATTISGAGQVWIDTAVDNLTTFSGANTFTVITRIETGGLQITNASGLGSGAKTNDIANGTAGEDNLRLDGVGILSSLLIIPFIPVQIQVHGEVFLT
ncbi:MAG: hypothetical protein ACKOXB_09930 [Flavobacteriales bacterium]